MGCYYLSCCWSLSDFPSRRTRQVGILDRCPCLPKTLWDCQAVRHLVWELDLRTWLFPGIKQSYPTNSKSSVYFVGTSFIFYAEATQQLAVYRIFWDQAVWLRILYFYISGLQQNYLHTWVSMPLVISAWFPRNSLSFLDWFCYHQIFCPHLWVLELVGFLFLW